MVDAVDRVVQEAAAATFLLPAACKERALAGYRILGGWYGLPAAVVVGVRRQPFLAHAWVECDGRVVTDDPERCSHLLAVVRASGRDLSPSYCVAGCQLKTVRLGAGISPRDQPERFPWH